MSARGFPVPNRAGTGLSPERNDTHLVSTGAELQGRWLQLTTQENWGIMFDNFQVLESDIKFHQWKFQMPSWIKRPKRKTVVSRTLITREVCRKYKTRKFPDEEWMLGAQPSLWRGWLGRAGQGWGEATGGPPKCIRAKMASWGFEVHHSQRNTSYAQNPSKAPSVSCTCHINPLNYVIVIILQKPPDVENEITPILQCQEHHEIA